MTARIIHVKHYVTKMNTFVLIFFSTSTPGMTLLYPGFYFFNKIFFKHCDYQHDCSFGYSTLSEETRT